MTPLSPSCSYILTKMLLTTPFIFTLSCFNKEASTRFNFWQPMSYIPNLSFGSTSASFTESFGTTQTNSVQDEHRCIRVLFLSIVTLMSRGGIFTIVKGRHVIGMVWIHFTIGDTSGNNRFLGQYNYNGNCSMPYRGCMCTFNDLELSNPMCSYITHQMVMDTRSCSKKPHPRLNGIPQWKRFQSILSKMPSWT